MKNVNFLKTILIAVVLVSLSATSFSDPAKTKTTPVKQKSVQEAIFDMYLSNTNDELIVNYLNPGGVNLMVKVYDIFGNVLTSSPANELNGKVTFSLALLESKGGTGTYIVEMTDGNGGGTKKGTIVIIRD
jgi:hypothetical protein